MTATAHKAFAFPVPRNKAAPAVEEKAPCGRTHHLQGAQHLRLDDAAGSTVRAIAGSVWITQDGDIRDIVLNAGDSFTLDRDGMALLSPLGEARFSVTSARCASFA